MARIEVCDVTKRYSLKTGEKLALSGISFSAKAGEAIGVIGENGSGKSTLLKIISGVTAPTTGSVKIAGKISALLELGAGFHPEYTGIENIYLNGTLQGQSRRETRENIPAILDFAEIGDFVYEPVKTYSDGMFLRLAFATAVQTKPDILVVDEALAVGDFLFQAKCFRKIRELKSSGVTILFVTHDIDVARRFCDRAIWLEAGRLRMDGPVDAVTAAYLTAALGQTATRQGQRFGDRVGAIRAVSGEKFWEYGKEVSVTVEVAIPPDAGEGLNLSLAVKNREGLDLLVFSAQEAGKALLPGVHRVTYRFPNLLCAGKYVLAVGLEKPGQTPIVYEDYWEGAMAVESVAEIPYFGNFHIPAEVTVDGKDQS